MLVITKSIKNYNILKVPEEGIENIPYILYINIYILSLKNNHH